MPVQRTAHATAIDCHDHDVLVLTSDGCVAVDLQRGLCASWHRGHVHRAPTVERALKIVAKHRVTVAFLGCDLPDAIFRRVQRGGADGVPVRIIGVREGGGTLLAIRLMSRRLIAAYVSLPVSLASLEALARQSGPYTSRARAPLRGVAA